MIDFQSLAIGRCPSHLTAILPLPAGEGRGEGESFGIQFRAGSDTGGLNHRGRQSALIKVGEHGTRPCSRAVPFSHSVVLSKPLLATFHMVPWCQESVFIGVYPWLKKAFNLQFSQAWPRPLRFLPRLSKAAAGFFQAYPRSFRTFSKVIQAYPRLSKVILEKKDGIIPLT